MKNGTMLAHAGLPVRGTPGSSIKPLLLQYGLQHGIIRPETQVYCRRNLEIDGRHLRCSHGADRTVFDAESALAASCNTWFAEMGRRFSDEQLEAALQGTHLPHASMLAATVRQRQLAVLGLYGVSVSPEELARAYRELLLRLPLDGTVARGLRDSVAYGMADAAAVPGVDILGKTGTASANGQAWTHGWFAGAIPGHMVIVVYVPRGTGGAAAATAQRFLKIVSAGQQ